MDDARSNRPTKRLVRLRWLPVLIGACMAISLALASSASAITFGLSFPGYPSDMQAVGKSGAGFFRVQISPTESEATLNGLFGSAAENGVTILPYLVGRLDGQAGVPPAGERTQWESWESSLVERYGYNGTFWQGKFPKEFTGSPHPVTAWEVWNEPNNPGNGASYGTAAEFGQFIAWAGPALQAASNAQAGRGTEVVLGGLLAWSMGTGYQTYLGGVWSVPGAAGSVTGIGLHPYELDTTQFPGTTREAAFQNSITGARSYINGLSGGSGKALWITEFGWPVESAEYSVSESEQATLLKESFAWLGSHSGGLGIAAGIWWDNQDSGAANIWQNRCGLANFAGAPRLSWWAYLETMGRPFWPTAANWFEENLGGAMTADPGISSWGPNRLDVFARGADNALYHDWWEGGLGWQGWGYLGGVIASGPSATSWGPGRIDVGALAPDGSLAHTWFQPNSWFSDNLGGTFTSDPGFSSWGENRIDIVGRGAEHALWHKFWNGLGWSAWEYVGGDLNSAPSIVSWEPNRLDVVALAANNTVAHTWWTNGQWFSDNIGGNFLSAPAIASPEPGRLDAFGRGVENGLWHNAFLPGVGWTGWQRIGGPIYSAPAAVAKEKNRIDVVGMGFNNSVEHWWWQGP
jgi:repeat uncharacterized protein DUF346